MCEYKCSIYFCVHACMSIYIYIYVCVCVCVFVCVCVCLCVCVCVCVSKDRLQLFYDSRQTIVSWYATYFKQDNTILGKLHEKIHYTVSEVYSNSTQTAATRGKILVTNHTGTFLFCFHYFIIYWSKTWHAVFLSTQKRYYACVQLRDRLVRNEEANKLFT